MTALSQVTSLRRRLRQLRMRAWLVEGRERHTGEPLTMYFAGRHLNMQYLKSVAFGSDVGVQRLSRDGVWKRQLGRQYWGGAHLVVREMPAPLWVTVNGAAFNVPVWVGGYTLTRGLAERIKASRDLKNEVRRVRNNGFSHNVTCDPHAVRRFYHEMYLPYMAAAHGETSFTTGWEEVKQQADSSYLISIHRHGREVAGTLIDVSGSVPRGWCLGVRDADREQIKAGALAAIYYYTLVQLAETGHERLHFGASRAFLRDGALHYKRKWGFTLCDCTPQRFAITAREYTPGVAGFLNHNPFIHVAGGDFYGVQHCVGGGAPDPDARELQALHVPGMTAVRVHRLEAAGCVWRPVSVGA